MNFNPIAQTCLDQGNILYGQGRFEGAIEYYNRAIKADPNCSDAYNNWGFALAALGLFGESESKYGRATQIDPEFCQAFYNWGNALRRQGKLDEAINRYKRAVTINPQYSLAYNNWGVTLNAMGRFEEAILIYAKSIEIDPKYSQAFNNWGFALDAQGRYEEAIVKYLSAIETDPNYSDAYDNLGNALTALGRYGEAMVHYGRAVSLQPKHKEAYFNWGMALLYQSRLAEAEIKFKKALDISPDYILCHFFLVLVLHMKNQLSDAMFLKNEVLKVIKRDPNALAFLERSVVAEINRAERKLARTRTEMQKIQLIEKIEFMKKTLDDFMRGDNQSQQRSSISSTILQAKISGLQPQSSLDPKSVPGSPLNSSNTTVASFSPTSSEASSPISASRQTSESLLSPLLNLKEVKFEQDPILADLALKEYYEFLIEELRRIFGGTFNIRNGIIEESRGLLTSAITVAASFLPHLSKVQYATKAFPFLSKVAPDGISQEDVIQLRTLNKMSHKFFNNINSMEVMDEILNALATEMTLLRSDALKSIANAPLQSNNTDKLKRAYEKGLTNRTILKRATEECAFLDLGNLLVLCFLEGVKLPNYIEPNLKASKISRTIVGKMQNFFEAQKAVGISGM